VDGRALNFHLFGINNENFIMRDDETGTWWQQINGEAIQGPLAGRRLNPVEHDELSFSVWKGEQPTGRVLRPDPRFEKGYVPANWEEKIAKFPVVTPAAPGDALPQRELIVGITLNGASKAYPMSKIQQQSPVTDTLGGVPIIIVASEKSVRAFERMVDGKQLDLFAKQSVTPLTLVDTQTGSEWDFSGKCIAGSMNGKKLNKISSLSDYWFDWKTYHPDTLVY